MRKQSINSIIISTLIILLSACGGEESGDTSQIVASSTSPVVTSDSADSTTPVETSDSADSTTPVVTSDSADSTTPVGTSDSTTKLVIMNAGAISGLKVMCNSTELVTDTDGSIECEETPVTVYLGEFKLGDVSSVPIDGLIYTQDLLQITRSAIAHPEVTKLSMILQSLDKDADPLNGITLDSNVLGLLGSHLNTSTALEDLTFLDVENIINDVIQTALSQDSNSTLEAVDYYTAQSNLAITIAGEI